RAGATGLAEITALGIPAVLVPYPYSAEGHQEVNAKFLEESNAAVMVKDQDFNGKMLLKLVKDILYDEKRLKEMSKNSKNLAKLNASDKLVDIIESLVWEE
ncbi:MAG: undecaprenyldiphospho-muramoylpentapeptide beta-N-acetylglucosaminyltransferase, partial [Halanaerobiales bacterium]|nr:undecaprenyldiphospho-muramoylpentapeptide beta-N-acetylglucosaminyltransferase [Halanaerobiales bacterium]